MPSGGEGNVNGRDSLIDHAWESVIWIGGPHDGLRQSVIPGQGDLPLARVCDCHGALYIAEPFDGEWRLNYAERWTSATAGEHEAASLRVLP